MISIHQNQVSSKISIILTNFALAIRIHDLCRAKCAAGPPSSLTHKAQSFQTQTTMKHILKAIPVGVLSALAVLLVAYFSLDADPLGDTNLDEVDEIAQGLERFLQDVTITL